MIRCVFALLLLALPSRLAAAPPEVIDARFSLSLFAEHPTVRTPVGCAVDENGRLLVIESHTHFAPDGYEGPKSDRILALSDTDGDGKADKTEVYWNAGKHLMSIAYDPRMKHCYIASRFRIFRIAAHTRPGEEIELARLDTTGDYPHNGLAGLALVPSTFRPPATGNAEKVLPYPDVYFGLGENLGHPYQLIAKDGTTLAGGGEGGNIYRMDGDGDRLRRIATGFWNPFGICQSKGQLFTVDNDPDSRPPNRLLHVVEGGDYGYQFRYGRPGTHPLQSWNGEFPGTLPMVAGTGEAACSIMPFRDELLVTSWGHHRIESYHLEPRGTSFSATMKTIVRGDENFRPVGIAKAADDAIYFTDWVDKSYPVHGKGRIWKLTPKPLPTAPQPARDPKPAPAKIGDPFALTKRLNTASDPELLAAIRSPESPPLEKAHAIAALRFRGATPSADLIRNALHDSSPAVQIAAVRWLSDLELTGHTDDLLALASRTAEHPRLFDAVTATLIRLAPDAPKFDREAMLLASAVNKYLPAAERVAALRRIDPDSKKLPIATYRELLEDPMPSVAETATWHLTQRHTKDAKPLLEKLAAGGHPDATLFTGTPPPPATNPPRDAGAWLALLEVEGAAADADAGRRVFFADHLGMCARCHTHGGYGNAVGPDLTGIGEREELPKLLESIVAPNREIAPMFRPQVIEKNDGELVVGLPIETTGRHGTGAETLIGVDGQPFEVPLSDIKTRTLWVASLMPAGLDTRLSIQQMRDLIAFLKTTP